MEYLKYFSSKSYILSIKHNLLIKHVTTEMCVKNPEELMKSPLTAYLGVQCNMGDEIYISHEMKAPGLLNIALLKCVWDSILFKYF